MYIVCVPYGGYLYIFGRVCAGATPPVVDLILPVLAVCLLMRENPHGPPPDIGSVGRRRRPLIDIMMGVDGWWHERVRNLIVCARVFASGAPSVRSRRQRK